MNSYKKSSNSDLQSLLEAIFEVHQEKYRFHADYDKKSEERKEVLLQYLGMDSSESLYISTLSDWSKEELSYFINDEEQERYI